MTNISTLNNSAPQPPSGLPDEIWEQIINKIPGISIDPHIFHQENNFEIPSTRYAPSTEYTELYKINSEREKEKIKLKQDAREFFQTRAALAKTCKDFRNIVYSEDFLLSHVQFEDLHNPDAFTKERAKKATAPFKYESVTIFPRTDKTLNEYNEKDILQLKKNRLSEFVKNKETFFLGSTCEDSENIKNLVDRAQVIGETLWTSRILQPLFLILANLPPLLLLTLPFYLYSSIAIIYSIYAIVILTLSVFFLIERIRSHGFFKEIVLKGKDSFPIFYAIIAQAILTSLTVFAHLLLKTSTLYTFSLVSTPLLIFTIIGQILIYLINRKCKKEADTDLKNLEAMKKSFGLNPDFSFIN